MWAYLETLNQNFDIIGLSETWLKENIYKMAASLT